MGAVLPSGASASTSCSLGADGTLAVTHTGSEIPTTIGGGLSPTIPGQTLIGVSGGTLTNCPMRTGAEVARISFEQAAGVSNLNILEPAALRRGAGAPVPAETEIPVDISDPTATDGTLVNMVLLDGDGLPEHWVFSTNGTTPAAPMAVNVNASEAAPDFDIVMSTPALATFIAVGSPGADIIDGSGAGQAPPHQRVLNIQGAGGADVLKGGTRDDIIDGGPGDDAIDGGPGFDVADYAASLLPVSVYLAAPGPHDDGRRGRDTLTSIEDLDGGEAGDVLRGTVANETFGGGLGDDVMEGRGGDDALFGDVGSDTASYASATGPITLDLALATPQATGGAGTDRLDQVENVTGGQDTDVLRGSDGPNTIAGGPGGDAMLAQGGDDTVLARDGGPDTVNCGPGADRAEVDPGGIDAVAGCESVVAGVAAGLAGPGGTAGPGSSARRRVVASLTGPKRQRLVRGAVTLRLGCPALSCAARATASTKLRLGAGPRRHRVILRPARARIIAGKSKLLRLALAPKGLAKVRAALAAGRRPVVRVTVVVTDAAAAKRTFRRTIGLLP